MKKKPKYFTVKVIDNSTSETHYVWGGPYNDATEDEILKPSIKNYADKNGIVDYDYEVVETTDRDPLLPQD